MSHPVEKVGRKFFYGWVVVIASFFVAMMGYGGAYSFGVFLKPLREDFGWTAAAISGAFSFYTLSYCSLSILSGWAVDRFGPQITIGLGGLFMGLGLSFSSQVNTLWHIYITYGFLIGPGMSTVYSPLLTTTSRWFKNRRGLALGIVTSGIGVGTLIIPLLASYLISTHGWKLSYLIIGPIIGGIIITAAFFLKKDLSQRGKASEGKMLSERLDRGTSGREEIKRDEIISDAIGLSIGEAAGSKVFWLLSLMNLMVGFTQMMILAHVVPYVQEGPKLSPIIAAALLSAISAASIAGRLIMGAALDHIGWKRALTICTSIQGVMIIGFIASSSAWMLYLFAAIYGFGYGGNAPQFPALTGELFGLRQMGTILGTQTIFFGIGGALGPFLAGYLFDTTGSYINAFALAAIAMFLTATFTFFLKKPKAMET
jgi:OFA family oxalate/formate antiporter-like MFS transporter